MSTDDTLAELRAIEPRNDRDLALFTDFIMWFVTSAAILAVSFGYPDLVPHNVGMWRALLGGSALVFSFSLITVARRLSERNTYRLLVTYTTITVTTFVTMMLIAPRGAPAVALLMLLSVIFAAFFYGTRPLLYTLCIATISVIVPAVINSADSTAEHMVARLAVLIPVMWLVAAAVHIQKRERDAALRASEQQAFTDPLTGVANLRALNRSGANVLSDQSDRGEKVAALLLIDLDDFKSANTLYGHLGGDRLLRDVGAALRRVAGPGHTVARIGGDEFAVLIERADRRDLADIAISYERAVQSARSDAMPDLVVDASVGIAVAPDDGDTLEQLLSQADAAMYRAKHKRSDAPIVSSRGSELTVPLAGARAKLVLGPKWADSASAASESSSTAGLAWNDRPEFARLATAAWAMGTVLILLSMAMPDADNSKLKYALPFVLAGVIPTAMNYFFAPRAGSARGVFTDVMTLVSIGMAAYLTGGSDSPAWPVVFLFIAYQGWYLGPRAMLLMLVGPILVFASPLVYEHLRPGVEGMSTVASIYAGALVATLLTLSMSYNRFYLDRARAMTIRLANEDPLTGLANRRRFEQRLSEQLDAPPEIAASELAVVMIDLDDFARVNTEHGHQVGDDLLCRIATSLRESMRADDLIARVGGDEFAIVAVHTDADDARALANRCIAAVIRCAEGSELAACRAVSASAGLALYPLHGKTLDELVDAADSALMSVKKLGKGKAHGAFAVAGR